MNFISIIIPIYNAEKTITRCLDSILETKYENYEVILVDDGSTDDSRDIIAKYLSKNKHLVLVTQENKGPSVARNKGLEIAKGDIITFVDSDDYVTNNYLTDLAAAFDEKHADIVFFEFNRVTPAGEIISKHVLPEFEGDFYKNLVSLSKKDMFGYTWIKAFRKSIIGNIRFDCTLNLFEDEVFTCEVLQKPVNMFFLRRPIYNYVRLEGTLANRTHLDYWEKCERVYCAWKKMLDNSEFVDDFIQSKANHMLNVCKYYGFERINNSVEFFKHVSTCSFCEDCITSDSFINAVKSHKWLYIRCCCVFYNLKIRMAKKIRKGSGNEKSK